MRQEVRLPMGTMVQVIAGEVGFMQMGPQARPLSDSQLADAQRQLRRDPIALLRLRKSDGFEAVHTGEDEVDSVAIELVNVRVERDSMTLGIDPDSGHIRSLGYRGNIMGAPGDVRQVLSDFREVDGLLLPFVSSTTLNGNPALEVRGESFVLDGAIDPALFEMPDDSSSLGS